VNEPEVSWKSIEKGAHVFASDGEELGKVAEIAGDSEADIFSGLVVSLSRLSSNRFLPAEQVTGIWPDRVATSIASDQVESLEEYKDPVAEHWQPPAPGFLSRLFGRR
jgi:sporulation protein YlmC with PRC-barrel domain